MGIDKGTGQLRLPVENIQARPTCASGIRGQTGSMTQVVNSFVTVQGGGNRRLLKSAINKKTTSGTTQNLKQAKISAFATTLMEATLEIPLGVTVVRDIIKQ